MKNDPHNEHREEAKKIRRKYHRILEKLRIKSLIHNDNEAARQMIVELTNYYTALGKIGYRTTSENEPGMAGRIVAITQEWIDQEKAKETQRDRDLKSYRKAVSDGDKEAATKFLRLVVLGL